MPVEIINVDDLEIEFIGSTKQTFSVPEDDPDIVHLPVSATSRQQQHRSQAGPSSSGGPSQVMSDIRAIVAPHEQQSRNSRKRASESALADPPPRKQQRTAASTSTTAPKRKTPSDTGTTKFKPNQPNDTASPLNTPVVNSASSSGFAAKRKESEIIDLCTSSDEDVKPKIKKPKKATASPPIPTNKTRVKVKVELPESDSDYDDAHAGLDLRDESNWTPLPKHDNEDLTSSLEIMSLTQSAANLSQPFRGSFDPPRLDLGVNPWDGRYFWTSLRKSIHRPPTITRRRHRYIDNVQTPISAVKVDNLQAEFNTFSLSSAFRKSSGPINRISQHGPIIAICSATSGGNFDDGSELRNPHNKANSLMVCRDNQMRTCRRFGHNSSAYDAVEKYYTVNDVKFDPSCSNRMVSSGNDCKVRVWEHVDSYDGFDSYDNSSSEDVPDSLPAAVKLVYTLNYTKPPLDIAYQVLERDNTCQPVFAVACSNGNLYTYSADGDPDSETVFAIAPPKGNHSVGAITWGRDQTSAYLFASSEPPSDRGDHSGAHRALDIHEGKIAYNFSARAAGDAITVDESGRRLALFTRGLSESNILRIYDISRKNGRQPTSTINLETFAKEGEDDDGGEVNCTAFSPDGIYLAVARNDNVVHVYDSRNLERGVLHCFQHNYPNREVAGFKGFGVVEIQWVNSFDGRGLGLISGGNDGCVRLWDISQATDNLANGRVIAETDFDVAHFSIGDKSKGEAPLVVGDSGGGISIFDRLGNSY